MRKLILSEFITLDGVIQAPGDTAEMERGGWSFLFFNDEYMQYKAEELFASVAILLGRVTYEGFAKAWPERAGDDAFADRMNELPKYVVSTTLEKAEWNNSHIIKGNIVEEVSRLKQQPGQDILLMGSGKLAHTLMQADLIDEYRLMVHPIILGRGKRLFNEEDQKVLQLVDSKTFRSGIVVLTYQPERNA